MFLQSDELASLMFNSEHSAPFFHFGSVLPCRAAACATRLDVYLAVRHRLSMVLFVLLGDVMSRKSYELSCRAKTPSGQARVRMRMHSVDVLRPTYCRAFDVAFSRLRRQTSLSPT